MTVVELPPAGERRVTITDGIREALQVAGPHGLSMAAIAGVVTGPWRSRDVDDVVRKLWEANVLARRGDGTFVLTGNVGNYAAPETHRRAAKKFDAAVKRVAASGRREGYDTRITTRTVDPALLQAWCAGCRKNVRPRLDGTCTTCGTQTGANVEAPAPPRRRRRRKPLKEGQPGFGIVCRCGARKSKQAHTCRTCSTKRRAGRKLGPRRTQKPPRSITEELLLEARRLYATGLSLRQIAAQIHDQTSYKSVASCAEGLYSLFKTRGWKLRPQAEVTRARNFKHGRKSRRRTPEQEQAYRRWLASQRGWKTIHGPGRPTCIGTRRQHPRKGEPCTRPALEDSEYCYSHDPRYEADRQAVTARMRAKARYREPVVPAAPFAAWLTEQYEQLGTWVAVGELIGADSSAAKRWGTGQVQRVAVRVLERSADNAGTTVGAIYDQIDLARAA